MQLVEQHIIDHNDPRYAIIDAAALASKNLYNAANYLIRQTYIFQGRYLNYYAVLKETAQARQSRDAQATKGNTSLPVFLATKASGIKKRGQQ